MEIPLVGLFIVRQGIAAVAFKSDLSSETKGVTAKTHTMNNPFTTSANRLNMQIHDQDSVKKQPKAGLGGGMMLTHDAEDWLRNNLSISV